MFMLEAVHISHQLQTIINVMLLVFLLIKHVTIHPLLKVDSKVINFEEESGENYYLGFVWDISEGLSFTMDAFHVKLEGAVTNLDVFKTSLIEKVIV